MPSQAFFGAGVRLAVARGAVAGASGVAPSRIRITQAAVAVVTNHVEGALAHPSDLGAITAQLGTAAARNDAPLQRRQGRWHLCAFECDGSRCLPVPAMGE